jgi:hypothetical protein
MCYESRFDGQSGVVPPQFYVSKRGKRPKNFHFIRELWAKDSNYRIINNYIIYKVENMANSTVAKVCNRSNKNNPGIHGIALGICVENDLDKSKFMMHAQMQTSYSEKRSVVVKIAHMA